MFFDTNFRPENICHEDKTRTTITTVELVREEKGHFLVATNGVSLIKVPCSGVSDAETLGPIQPEAFELARKLAKKAKSGVAEIRCGRDLLTFADGSTAPRVSHGDARFTDYQRVIPARGDPRHLDVALFEASKHNPGPYTLRFGLDPALLSEIAKAQGRKGVVELEITIEPPHAEEKDTCRVHVPIEPPHAEEKDTCRVHAPILLHYSDGVGVVMPGLVG